MGSASLSLPEIMGSAMITATDNTMMPQRLGVRKKRWCIDLKNDINWSHHQINSKNHRDKFQYDFVFGSYCGISISQGPPAFFQIVEVPYPSWCNRCKPQPNQFLACGSPYLDEKGESIALHHSGEILRST